MSIIKTFKIESIEESKELQAILFDQEYRWKIGGKEVKGLGYEYINIWDDRILTYCREYDPSFDGELILAKDYIAEHTKTTSQENPHFIAGNFVKLIDSSKLFLIANSKENGKTLVSMDGKEGMAFERYKDKIVEIYQIKTLNFSEKSMKGLEKVWEKEYDTITENELYKLYGGYVKVAPSKNKDF